MKLHRLLTALSFILLSSAVMAQQRYAEHSKLATGHWTKIRVAQTGPCMITDDLLQQAGFTDPSRVRIYGYGGALQPEKLEAAYLAKTDDLPEVRFLAVDGGLLFHAVGPVNYELPSSTARILNPYSDYGYYFLT